MRRYQTREGIQDVGTFTDKVVIVTGGGAGIGRAAAIQFASQGARVIVTGRRIEPLKALAAKHRNIVFTVADASSEEDAVKTVEGAIYRYGRLDALVNNAGAGASEPLTTMNERKIAALFAVNVFGPSMLASAAVPHLAATGGSIVNVSSSYGHKAAAMLSHYAASKAALEHLTRCWALELADSGIRVNAVAAVQAGEGDRIPRTRRDTPEDVARWIVSLASPAAGWITGQVVAVDGGSSIN